MRLVASVCLFVGVFVGTVNQLNTHLPLSVQGLRVCVCYQLLFRQVAPSRSITLLIQFTSCNMGGKIGSSTRKFSISDNKTAPQYWFSKNR